MADKEKLEKLKKLADAMYYAAQQLTTDASRLHKAMDEYHKFIIHECKEEPTSEELEEAAWFYADRKACLDKSVFTQKEVNEKRSKLEYNWEDIRIAFKAGTQWQKEQFEKDYTDLCNGIATAKGVAVAMAYDKGMADAKEQMMANAIDGKVIANGMGNPILHLWDKGRHLIDKKVKVIVIKED